MYREVLVLTKNHRIQWTVTDSLNVVFITTSTCNLRLINMVRNYFSAASFGLGNSSLRRPCHLPKNPPVHVFESAHV